MGFSFWSSVANSLFGSGAAGGGHAPAQQHGAPAQEHAGPDPHHNQGSPWLDRTHDVIRTGENAEIFGHWAEHLLTSGNAAATASHTAPQAAPFAASPVAPAASAAAAAPRTIPTAPLAMPQTPGWMEYLDNVNGARQEMGLPIPTRMPQPSLLTPQTPNLVQYVDDINAARQGMGLPIPTQMQPRPLLTPQTPNLVQYLDDLELAGGGASGAPASAARAAAPMGEAPAAAAASQAHSPAGPSGFGRWLGGPAGIVGGAMEINHGVHDWQAGDRGLGGAQVGSGLMGVGGGALTLGGSALAPPVAAGAAFTGMLTHGEKVSKEQGLFGRDESSKQNLSPFDLAARATVGTDDWVQSKLGDGVLGNIAGKTAATAVGLPSFAAAATYDVGAGIVDTTKSVGGLIANGAKSLFSGW